MTKSDSTSSLTDAGQGVIFSIKKYSMHDGPGIRTTVFLKGCPLNCWWCHNPESKKLAPEPVKQGANRPFSGFAGSDGKVGRIMTVDEVIAEVKKDEIFYDESGGGVTFSGGEPLMQPDFLVALLHAAKRYDFHTAVDTSGFASAEVFECILPLTDLFLYDLKLMDDDAHRKYAGTPVAPVLDNLAWLARSGANVIVRIPIVPGITDTPENLDSIIRFLLERSVLRNVSILALNHLGDQKYIRLGMENKLGTLKVPSQERMAELQERFIRKGLHCTIGG
ncbi:glycyl-radical enzyme activating protein [bacterium]|nr:glycyl-radical enzyme activating protein [bacterium]